FSDDALAEAFSEKYPDFRYVAAWAKWVVFQGTHWQTDSTLLVFDRIREVCREATAATTRRKEQVRLASARTVASVERLARADRRHAATADQWDADIWLLNTPGGTLDLKTGKMRPHDPKDYITKSTSVSPGGDCRTWKKFLDEVTDGDVELQAYLQRVLG